MSRVHEAGLDIAEPLYRFVADEALPGTGISPASFWSATARIVADIGPRIADLLAVREGLQRQLDAFHLAGPGQPDPVEYERFLREIGYLVDAPEDFQITTSGVDSEVATVAGPQLVVPLLNARFATNAANARWGSLYDALYGSDAIEESGGRSKGPGYNPVRGAEVIARGRAFLDAHFPLAGCSHAEVTAYRIRGGGLVADHATGPVGLAEPSQLAGHRGPADAPTAVLFVNNGLHVELAIDPADSIGSTDLAGVRDIVLEAALTTIMDLEDSVSAVDADDKVLGYRNWLLLMQGTLSQQVTKAGRTFTRSLNPDRTYCAPDGADLVLPGRSLLFVRQVGHLMTTDAVLDAAGDPVSEGVLDALVTALGSLHDLRGDTARGNSRTGSIYVVKPKMHGPDEVALTCDLFSQVERALGLDHGTIKVGIMDEERRTSVNLKACIHAARDRVVFINTGFLDRTGDEIRTSTYAGPMVRKAEMRQQPWLDAYEMANVHTGLASGFQGRAQIGKGMWAAPDDMAEMLKQKAAHPLAGATCAWVPSPTAATLHAIHYHRVDVTARQNAVRREPQPALADLLTIPLGDPASLPEDQVRAELENNLQSALGYVVRWIEMGVGCSKVPDIHGTALMEDRATCRISTQHVANWLWHGVITHEQLDQAMRRMALVVDEQNAGDPDYRPIADDPSSEAFQAVRELVLDGLAQPSGYTEPVLHRRRQLEKRHHPNPEGSTACD